MIICIFYKLRGLTDTPFNSPMGISRGCWKDWLLIEHGTSVGSNKLREKRGINFLNELLSKYVLGAWSPSSQTLKESPSESPMVTDLGDLVHWLIWLKLLLQEQHRGHLLVLGIRNLKLPSTGSRSVI